MTVKVKKMLSIQMLLKTRKGQAELDVYIPI